MTHQDGPTEAVRLLVDSMDGQIWNTTTDMAAGGTGVNVADIKAEFEVPGRAKTLLGYRPIATPDGIAAAESNQSVFIIQGDNYGFTPQEVLGPNAPSILKDGVHLLSASEWYPVNAPAQGGVSWQISQEPVDAQAGNFRVGVEFTWADVDLQDSLPVIYSKCSREVSIDAGGISPGTTLKLDKVHKIIEVGAASMQAALALEEQLNLDLILKATSLGVQEIRIMLDGIPGPLDGTTDNGSAIGRVNRRTVSVRSDETLIDVTADFDQDVDLAVAVAGVHMIRWI